NDGYFWQSLSIPVGTKIALSGYIKTENVLGDGVYLRVYFLSRDGKYISSPTVYSPTITGTTDWTKYTVSITVPEEAASTRIELDLSEATGTVWFDDLEVIKTQ
ncbi:MAG: hypothetical protein Q7J27_00840, partial [Syntrophales bacterium]|nr:hypothetical protein [Syntrophales bacterium]